MRYDYAYGYAQEVFGFFLRRERLVVSLLYVYFCTSNGISQSIAWSLSFQLMGIRCRIVFVVVCSK
jgi:hypothetical protein